MFAHVVAEQPLDPGTSSGARLPGALVGDGFALTLATLVQARGARRGAEGRGDRSPLRALLLSPHARTHAHAHVDTRTPPARA